MKRHGRRPAFGLDELGRSVADALATMLAAVGHPTGGQQAFPASILLRAGLAREGGPGTGDAISPMSQDGGLRFRLAAVIDKAPTVAELRWRIECPSTLVVRWKDKS
jgi:hypothetical protein